MKLHEMATRVSLYALLGLAACQKETQPEPQLSFPTRSDDGRAKFVGKMYTLVKHGNATLAYGNDGRLNLVTYATGAISHVTYTPGFFNSKSVQVIGYLRSNNQMSYNTKFLVDASGRCYEEQTTHYWYNAGGVQSQTDTYAFEYNAQGYLKKRYDKSNPNQHYDYTFNAAGDLTKMNKFAPNNGQPSGVTQFSYEAYVGAPLTTDRYSLNNTWAGVPEEYLKIFGKTSKHLVKRMTYKNLYSNAIELDRTYTYTLNGDGYVTQQNFQDAGDNKVYLKPYEYSVSVVLP